MGNEMTDNSALIFGVILGVIFFVLIKVSLEPWVIEVTCRELIKC